MTSHNGRSAEHIEAMERLEKTENLIAMNAEGIAELRQTIAETAANIAKTHTDVVKLERKADSLISLMTHMMQGERGESK